MSAITQSYFDREVAFSLSLLTIIPSLRTTQIKVFHKRSVV